MEDRPKNKIANHIWLVKAKIVNVVKFRINTQTKLYIPA